MNNDARALLSRLITKGIARRLFMDYSNEYSELMNRYLDDELALEETKALADLALEHIDELVGVEE